MRIKFGVVILISSLLAAHSLYIYFWFQKTDLSLVIASEFYPGEVDLIWGKLPMLPGTARAYLKLIGVNEFSRRAHKDGVNEFSLCEMSTLEERSGLRREEMVSWLFENGYFDVCATNAVGDNLLNYFEENHCVYVKESVKAMKSFNNCPKKTE